MPTATELNALLGTHISGICTCDYADDSHNHCAHFVSHTAKFNFGYTCFNQTGKGQRSDGANIRVSFRSLCQCRNLGVETGDTRFGPDLYYEDLRRERGHKGNGEYPQKTHRLLSRHRCLALFEQP